MVYARTAIAPRLVAAPDEPAEVRVAGFDRLAVPFPSTERLGNL